MLIELHVIYAIHIVFLKICHGNRTSQSDIFHSSYKGYFRHLLHVVPARNALLNPFWYFQFKHFTFTCCSRGFHLQIASNFLKYMFFVHIAHMPCLSKLCPVPLLHLRIKQKLAMEHLLPKT